MADDAAVLAEVEARKGSVTSMVTQKNFVGALTAALADPEKVLASKSANVKSANAAVVFQVIEAIEDKEIDGVLEGLDPLVMDLLMKYVYKGLGTPENANSLLKWHAKVLERCGPGGIVRSMTDRKTV
eukprot:CAMPEP_0205919462 /NCGR_PEP_ID=MMETSP1325-20131115/10460_1 /ASSEMBLY_ACC=CAM_ASM_000708 /TAXON_ID=236786 /ORGANISM="Florenciella sp., Strain RCC1007" /LENGTH=127 /DNA_ID=CAMNT_0053287075 /DNA_START=34 /DNA_END=417 /DNA_ORIENTATION=+